MNEKTKHTRGPWSVFIPEDGMVYEGGDCPATIRAGGIHVATMAGERWRFSETGKANARLIAAAPELLEALEFCLDRLSDHYSGPFGTQTDVAALAVTRAAIAKARGEKGGGL